jgi:hypothetical protein
MHDMDPQPSTEHNPRREYDVRLGARRAELEHQLARHRVIANARVATFIAGIVVVCLVFGPVRISVIWLSLPVAMFLFLVMRHDQVGRARRRAERAVEFYERGIARLEHRWSGTGQSGVRFVDENHPYALDLDLFGKGSIFELLCTARTRDGEDTLAAWLQRPAEAGEVGARQEAVRELRDRLDLREELALLGSQIPEGVDLSMLREWAGRPPLLTERWAARFAFILPAIAIAGLAMWLILDWSALPFLIGLLLEAAFAFRLHEPVQRVVQPVDRRARELAVFAGVLSRLEREQFQSVRLRELRASLETRGLVPSRRIADLERLIDWLNARRNPFFAPFAPVLLWTTQYAFAIEAWRVAVGPGVKRWLDVVGEFEALCALAAYAYENPADPFPEVVGGEAFFDGKLLGHPLIPPDVCVRNDVCLGGALRLLSISGSNMSGKSTLLRTVGVNTVLALAGAPVRATRLRLSPLAVGATLRIQDSLQAGRSRFYAEITRLRQLLDLAGKAPPLLFLLDELLQGTNSHDRRLGAEAVITSLLDLGAIGLVTTHDLALTQIADQLGARAANVHFQDQLTDGKMTFDYHMQQGVVHHSNALALMRAVGIKV